MNYTSASITFAVILLIVIFLLWGMPFIMREKFHPSQAKKENYGPPPGMIRSTHQDEIQVARWADAPCDYEGNTPSSLSAYIMMG